jgi:hypothetical protein
MDTTSLSFVCFGCELVGVCKDEALGTDVLAWFVDYNLAVVLLPLAMKVSPARYLLYL